MCAIYILRMYCVLILQVFLSIPWPTGTLFPRPCPSHEGHLHLCTLIGLSMAMRPSDCLERSPRAYVYASLTCREFLLISLYFYNYMSLPRRTSSFTLVNWPLDGHAI